MLDSRATPAMAHRMEAAKGDLDAELFALIMMGDDRAVRQTYVAGRRARSEPAQRANSERHTVSMTRCSAPRTLSATWLASALPTVCIAVAGSIEDTSTSPLS